MNAILSAVPANVIVDATAVVADANAVVLHDTAAVAAATTPAIASAYKELEAIAVAKDTWEATAYRTSNDQLYALLQRCYGLYKLMCCDGESAKQLVVDVDKYLADKGYKVASSSHTLAKIVKAVFGVDRRRVSAYSIALRAALAANVDVVNIPQYIRNSGGVEELRLAKSANAKTSKEKAALAKASVNSNVLLAVDLGLAPETLDTAKVGTQHVLIVTQRADGAFDVNALVSSTAAVNAALAAYYSQSKRDADKAAAGTQQANADAGQAQRIEEAAVSTLQ